MRKWDKFVLQKDTDFEKQLLKCYRIEKEALNIATKLLFHKVGNIYEPRPEQVSVGALFRCGICLESMLVLARDGYIGSTNALLRQVYEFLVWSKVAINTKDLEKLKSLHDNFYNYEMSGRADSLQNIFKHIRYSSQSLSAEQIIEEGKEAFNIYAFLTHASVYAQQCPVGTDDFYKNLEDCFGEIAMWILCYMELIKEHLKRSILEQSHSSQTEYEEDFLYGSYNYLAEIIRKQEVRIIRLFSGIENSLLYRCFAEAKWVME